MSKAKHLQTILRGQLLLLHTSPVSASSVSVGPSSLRILPARLLVGPSLDGPHPHTQPQGQAQAQGQAHVQGYHQARYHHHYHLTRSTVLYASSSSSRRHHSRARQREYLCRSSGCLLHTSSQNSVEATSPASSAAAATPSPPSGASTAPSGVGIGHVFETPLQWTSELPWIDPLTQSSYEPGKQPPLLNPNTNTNSSGTGTGTGTGISSSSGSTSFFDQPFQNTRHNFVFAHGASGFAKHPGKVALTPEEDQSYFSVQVGEDSYFRRHDALGVADGVGGWSGTTGKLFCVPRFFSSFCSCSVVCFVSMGFDMGR